MDTQLVAAITQRHELGRTREQIISELCEAGYTEQLAAEVYDDVVSSASDKNTTKAAESEELIAVEDDASTTVDDAAPIIIVEDESDEVPIIMTDDAEESAMPMLTKDRSEVATETETDADAEVYDADDTEITTAMNLKAVFLAAGIVLGVTAVAFLFIFGKSIPFNWSLLTGGTAPYANESELLAGLIEQSPHMNAFAFSSVYELQFEPKAAGTPVLQAQSVTAAFAEASNSGFSFPTEGYAKVHLSGTVDLRDIQAPAFDIEGGANILMEPILINVAGSLRLVDKKLYGKITKVPTLYEGLVDMVPKNQWLLLQENNFNLQETESLFAPQLLLQNSLPESVVGVAFMEPLLRGVEVALPVASLLSQLPRVEQGAVSQMASVIQPFADQDALTEEQKAALAEAKVLLIAHPPVRVVGVPTLVTKNEESFFEYELAIDYDNVVALYSAALSQVPGEQGIDEASLAAFLTQFPGREDFAIFNDIVDIVTTVRLDGSLAGVRATSVFAFPGEAQIGQVRLLIENNFTPQSDIHISVPDNVYEKSVEAILKERQEAALQAMSTADVRSSFEYLRVVAELSYNDNNSYATVCADPQLQDTLSVLGITAFDYGTTTYDTASALDVITCNDTATGYAVVAPLSVGSETSWCVDSTGFSGEVTPTALSSATDVRCKEDAE